MIFLVSFRFCCVSLRFVSFLLYLVSFLFRPVSACFVSFLFLFLDLQSHSKKRGCTSSSRILKMTVIVYDNKNLNITELEDTRQVFILFYLSVIKYNDPAVKI